jgi:molybdopterin-guanine dinucleotide biosynthesis protein A
MQPVSECPGKKRIISHEPRHDESDDMTGVILAGGKSRRMGRPKLFIDIGGIPMFERVYRVCEAVFTEVIIVANDSEPFRRYDAHLVPDIIPGKGPLGAIYTGLVHASQDHCFCVAADMPFLNIRLIRHMIERSAEGDVIIPKTSDGHHPLHAIYAKGCLKPIETLLSRGDLKIVDFFPEVTVIYVPEGEIRHYDPLLRCLTNVNTEDDFYHVQKLFEQDPSMNPG